MCKSWWSVEVVRYSTDLEMIEYYQKSCGWNSKSSKTIDCVKNYARLS